MYINFKFLRLVIDWIIFTQEKFYVVYAGKKGDMTALRSLDNSKFVRVDSDRDGLLVADLADLSTSSYYEACASSNSEACFLFKRTKMENGERKWRIIY